MGFRRRYDQNLVLAFLILLHIRSGQSNYFEATSYEFQECFSELCGVKELVRHSIGSLPCAMHCSADASCIGFSVRQNETKDDGGPIGDCYIHRDCFLGLCDLGWDQRAWMYVASRSFSQSNDYSGDFNIVFIGDQTCQNGGVWDDIFLRCECVDGWIDTYCDRRAEVCADLKTFGSYAEGSHKVHLGPSTSALPFTALCELGFDEINTIILRSGGEYDFNKSWQDYENGIYVNNEHNWLGLANIHALSQILNHDKVVLEITFTTDNYEKIISFDFSVGDSSTNYTLSVGSSILESSDLKSELQGDYLMDCLALSDRVPFSTYDAENCPCAEGKDCSTRAKAGWWYRGCDLECNPLGPWYDAWPQRFAEDRVMLPGLNLHNSSYAKNLKRVQLYFNYQGIDII